MKVYYRKLTDKGIEDIPIEAPINGQSGITIDVNGALFRISQDEEQPGLVIMDTSSRSRRLVIRLEVSNVIHLGSEPIGGK